MLDRERVTLPVARELVRVTRLRPRHADDAPVPRDQGARTPTRSLFYRMGDFYEMFLRDAEIAAPLLDIALTTRDKGKPDAVPMCGVPVHARRRPT